MASAAFVSESRSQPSVTQTGRVLQGAINSVVGAQNPHEFRFLPRMFRTMANTNGEKRYVLVREQPLVAIPGEARVRMHVFDNADRLLTSDEFSGGWRTHVTRVHVAKNALLSQDALVVDGEFWIGGIGSHHYYVLVGDRMVPAYLERDGKLKRDEYLFANPSIAPSIR